MTVKIYSKISSILWSHPELPVLIESAIGNPTFEKIQHTIAQYQASDHFLVGYLIELKLAGVIGIVIKEDHKAELKHIAVKPNYRQQGIARKMIENIIKKYSLSSIEAETDDDAIVFYEKCGFICTKVTRDSKNRYQCILNI